MWKLFLFAILCAIKINDSFQFESNKDVDMNKLCRYRDYDKPYPFHSWKEISAYFCYYWTPTDIRLNFKYNTSAIKDEYNTTVPVGLLNNGTIFRFDYDSPADMNLLRPSFKSEGFFRLWRDCSLEAYKCCELLMNNTNIVEDGEQCPVVWDAWSCYPQAPVNSISHVQCPRHTYSNEVADFCILESEKICYPNASWNVNTDYIPCAIAPIYTHRHNFHVLMLIIGSVLSLPALIIFIAFRQFRKTPRVILHRNLILVVIVRNILTIMTKEIILLDQLKSGNQSNHVADNNSIACRVLAFSECAAKNAIYASMLADGFYLHKMIVRTFANEPNLYVVYGIEAVLVFVPALAWAAWKAAVNETQCWMVDSANMQWISDGVRISILCVNFILLADIIRCMIVKRKSKNVTQQTIETFRATLFLMPLFGLHIIIITNRKMFGTHITCATEDIYYYISYSIEGLQSVFVAITFCYLNTEVHKNFKNAYRKLLLHLEQRYGWTFSKLNCRKPNVDANQRENFNRRRTTAQTYVG